MVFVLNIEISTLTVKIHGICNTAENLMDRFGIIFVLSWPVVFPFICLKNRMN